MRRSLKVPILLLGVMVSTGGLAQAVEFVQRASVFPERTYTCRLNGDDVRVGERRCLRTTQGARLAQCDIALNMSTWHALAENCP